MIEQKSKLAQFFCGHKNTGWYRKDFPFENLRGERHYKVCEKCGKVLGERFMEYEGMGFK